MGGPSVGVAGFSGGGGMFWVLVVEIEGWGLGLGLGLWREMDWQLEKRPLRTVGRCWEGLQWP